MKLSQIKNPEPGIYYITDKVYCDWINETKEPGYYYCDEYGMLLGPYKDLEEARAVFNKDNPPESHHRGCKCSQH